MKILIIGADHQNAIENLYVKYLRELGVEVNHYSAQAKFYDFYYKSLLNKVLYRLNLSTVLKKINIEIIDIVKKTSPDFVWVFKGMEIFPETLLQIQSLGIKLINYNPDNPFIFTGSGSGNNNIVKSISLYDIHFTYNLNTMNLLTDKFKRPTFWLPFGFDITEEEFAKAKQQPEIMKACFIGNPDKDRVKFIKEVAKNNTTIDIYGNHWDKYLKGAAFNIFPAIYRGQFWNNIRSYRIQLNPLRIHNADSHGMRSFEIPAIGGIMLAPRTSEHVQFFKENNEAFFYADAKEARQQINTILGYDNKNISAVRHNARQRSVTSGYSYFDRSKQVLDILNQLY